MKVLLPRLTAIAALALGASGALAHDLTFEGNTLHRLTDQAFRWESAPGTTSQQTPLGASVALVNDVTFEGDMLHRLTDQAFRWESAPGNSRQQATLGSPAGRPAGRLVVLDDSVRHLRVTQQEHVTFEAKGTRFTWNFDTLGTPTFDLAEIAPEGVDVGQVEVHVAPNPLYSGG